MINRRTFLVSTAAIGALGGAVFVLGRRALVDLKTVLIAIVALALLRKLRSAHEPWIIVGAGIAGILIF